MLINSDEVSRVGRQNWILLKPQILPDDVF